MHSTTLHLPELDLSLAYYEAGDPAGPPLLLLHGSSLAASIFAGHWLAPELRAFRLVALDLPGHGQSAPAPGHYGLPAGRAGLRAALRTLRLEQALVVAHSLSGLLLLLGLLPELPPLRGLVAVGAPPVSSRANVQAAFQSNATVGLYYAATITPAQTREMARFALRPEASATEVALLAAAIGRAHPVARPELGASLAAGELGDARGHAARTAVPLAFVAGADDRGLHLSY